jgi:hypothetical protein
LAFIEFLVSVISYRQGLFLRRTEKLADPEDLVEVLVARVCWRWM